MTNDGKIIFIRAAYERKKEKVGYRALNGCYAIRTVSIRIKLDLSIIPEDFRENIQILVSFDCMSESIPPFNNVVSKVTLKMRLCFTMLDKFIGNKSMPTNLDVDRGQEHTGQ